MSFLSDELQQNMNQLFFLNTPLKVILFWAVFVIVLLLTGSLFNRILKFEKNIASLLTQGFVILLAIFEIVELVISVTTNSFMLLCYVFSCIIFCIVLISSIFIVHPYMIKISNKKTQHKDQKRKKKKKAINGMWIFGFLFGVLVCIRLIGSIDTMYTGATDDSYYLLKAETAIQTGQIINSDTLISNGNEEYNYARPDISSWIIYMAYWSKLFNMSTTIFAHMAMGTFITLLMYIIAVLIASHLFEDSKKKAIFLILYYIFSIFPDSRIILQENWAQKYSWYGISVICMIIYIMYANCIALFHETRKAQIRKRWIYSFIIILACIAAEIVGIYISFISFFIMILPVIFVKNKGHVTKTLFRLFLCFLPLVPIGIVLLIKISKMGLYLGEKLYWTDIMLSYMLINPFFYLYLISIFYIWKKGKTEYKALFIGGPVLLLLTFMNPLLFDFIAGHITSYAAYYRMFWCIPFAYVIMYAATEFIYNSKTQTRARVSFVYAVALIVGLGHSIYLDAIPNTNIYKLPQEAYDVAVKLTQLTNGDDSVVLVSQDINHYVRQYNYNLKYIAGARSSGIIAVDSLNLSYADIYNQFFYDPKHDSYDWASIFKELGVQYVVVEASRPNLLNNVDYTEEYEVDKYIIVKCY